MRISDWSSDVCSSDLVPYDLERQLHEFHAPARPLSEAESARVEALSAENDQLVEQLEGELTDGTAEAEVANDSRDEIERELESIEESRARNSVVSGKSGYVRVELGGRRRFKNKTS